MPTLTDSEQLTAAMRLAIAALVGLAIGLERQWSGHATGPNARFAGLRTSLLLGVVGGSAGLLLARDFELAGATLIAGGVVFAIVAFAVAARRSADELDATTEVAAIVVIVLGVLAGLGWLMLAAGAGSVVVLVLYEKGRLHDAVARVGETELRAALRFGVLALVVLPLLPKSWTVAGYEVAPRGLWIIVLFLSALNFAAYLARRVVRADRGYALTGVLGGLVSSTVVTLDFSRRSRSEPALADSLAVGVIGACTVLVPRVLVVSFVLNAAVGAALIPFVLPMLAAGAAAVALLWRAASAPGAEQDPMPRNPLRLWYAIKMTIAFQAAMVLLDLVSQRWAASGVYATAAFLGVTDVDALTVSMSRAPDGLLPVVAARAITIGILANSVTKLGITSILGTGRYRLIAGGTLLVITALAAATIWLV